MSEKKAVSASFATMNMDSVGNTWVEYDIMDINQGDGNQTRTGNKVAIRSIEIKGVLTEGSNNGVTDDIYNAFRIFLAFWDGRSATPNATNTLGLSEPSFKGCGANQARGLQKKLWDKYIFLPVQSEGGTGYLPGGTEVTYYKKFKRPKTIYYSGATGADMNRKLILGCLSDSAAIVHPGFIAGYMVVRFVDF